MGLGEISLGEMGLGEMGLGEMGQNQSIMMEIRNLFHKAGSKWPTYGIQRKNKKQILRNS